MRTESNNKAIEFHGVSKRYQLQEGRTLREFVPAFLRGQGYTPPFYALVEVGLTVERGESLGIIGRNGSGKTSVLKLIAGVTAPSEGQVTVRGRVSPLIELGAGFHPDLTGRENVYLNASILGLPNREIRQRFADIVRFAELEEFIDTPIKRYSSGMYMRLAFSVAVHSDPDILLVDEVLSVGDAPFQERCLAKMREFQEKGVTVVFVSHQLPLVQQFCHRAIWLDGGRIVAEGAPETVVQQYVEALSQASEMAV